MPLGPKHGATVVRRCGRERFLRCEGHVGWQTGQVRHRTEGHGPVRTNLFADPVAQHRPVRKVLHFAGHVDAHVGHAVAFQVQTPTWSESRQRGGQRRKTRFSVGDERGPRVGKAHGVGFCPRGDAAFVVDAAVVGRARQRGVDAQAFVGLDDFELLLEKVRPLNVHLLHLFPIAARRIERGWNGDVPVTVGGQVLQKTPKAVATGDDRNARNVSVHRGDVTVGLGRVGQINDQPGRFLSRVAFRAGQLVQQPFGRLHAVAMG